MPKTTKKPVVELYTASIKIFGKVYTATGTTAREAIENLSQQRNIKGSGVLIVSRGTAKIEKILHANIILRLFSPSKLMREIALKNVSLMFSNI